MKHLRSIFPWILWLLLGTAGVLSQPVPASRVEAVGITVSDMDRSLNFYTHVLHFQKISDVELSGTGIEHFKGLFGVRVRVARLRLGNEELELSDYLAPQGRPLPLESHSNDLWFQPDSGVRVGIRRCEPPCPCWLTALELRVRRRIRRLGICWRPLGWLRLRVRRSSRRVRARVSSGSALARSLRLLTGLVLL